MSIKYFTLLLAVMSCLCFSGFAADDNEQIVINLDDNTVAEQTVLQGSGSTADADSATAENDAIDAYGSEETAKKSNVRIDTSGDDPYVLEEYSPNDYQTYDFSQVLPVKFQTENKKQSYVTNRANRLTLAKADVTVHTKENVRGQDAKFGLTEYEAQVSVPILYKGNNKLLFTVEYSMYDFDTDMRLKNDSPRKYGTQKLGDKLDSMQSLYFKLNYRYDVNNSEFAGGFFDGTTLGVDLILDSRSDILFNSIDETNFTGLVSYRMPIFENQAITVMAGYMSDFKLPIAGIGYQLNFGKTSYLNVGMPLNMVHINSADLPYLETERFNFDFNYILFGDLSAQLSYDIILGKLQVYSDFQWNTETWARANRSDTRARVFYTDCRWGAGIRADFLKYFYAKAEGGWAFSRNIYEDRNYFDYSKGYDIDDSAYLTLEAGIVF